MLKERGMCPRPDTAQSQSQDFDLILFFISVRQEEGQPFTIITDITDVLAEVLKN
jgi:hypothetical protein